MDRELARPQGCNVARHLVGNLWAKLGCTQKDVSRLLCGGSALAGMAACRAAAGMAAQALQEKRACDTWKLFFS